MSERQEETLRRVLKIADDAEARARQGYGYGVPLVSVPGFVRRLRVLAALVGDYEAAVKRLTVAQGRAWDEGAAVGRQLERDSAPTPPEAEQ